MWKHETNLVLSTLVVLTFVACGQNPQKNSTTPTASQQSEIKVSEAAMAAGGVPGANTIRLNGGVVDALTAQGSAQALVQISVKAGRSKDGTTPEIAQDEIVSQDPTFKPVDDLKDLDTVDKKMYFAGCDDDTQMKFKAKYPTLTPIVVPAPAADNKQPSVYLKANTVVLCGPSVLNYSTVAIVASNVLLQNFVQSVKGGAGQSFTLIANNLVLSGQSVIVAVQGSNLESQPTIIVSTLNPVTAADGVANTLLTIGAVGADSPRITPVTAPTNPTVIPAPTPTAPPVTPKADVESINP